MKKVLIFILTLSLFVSVFFMGKEAKADMVDFTPDTYSYFEDADVIYQQLLPFFKADGVTIISSLQLAQDELESGNDIIVQYNAVDSSLNLAIAVRITVTAVDDIDPVVTGLDDEEYISGTAITEKGKYTIVVTDDSGNITTMTFEIEGSNNVVIYSIVGVLVIGIGAGLYVMKVKHII